MSESTIIQPQDPTVFDALAPRYDLLNRILSLRQDVEWRKTLAKRLPDDRPIRVLDVATGTGDLVLSMLAARPNIEFCHGIDPAKKMLELGTQKLVKQGVDHRADLKYGDVQNLSDEDGYFDVVTTSFGIRNVPDFQKGLQEMKRVLKPGGQCLILEFSVPKNPLKLVYKPYFRYILPTIGRLFSGHPTAYKYLNESAEGFPTGDAFVAHMTDAGFKSVTQTPLSMGIVTLYEGVNP